MMSKIRALDIQCLQITPPPFCKYYSATKYFSQTYKPKVKIANIALSALAHPSYSRRGSILYFICTISTH